MPGARVSTKQQDLTRQTKALKRIGCAAIYSDKPSGKSLGGRPELARAHEDLDSGDAFVIAEWNRATRSMWDGLQIIKTVIDAGAVIKVLDRSYIDLKKPMPSGAIARSKAFSAAGPHLSQRKTEIGGAPCGRARRWPLCFFLLA
jgi:DNA invertase Pin-like site-specific DNA recombinase